MRFKEAFLVVSQEKSKTYKQKVSSVPLYDEAILRTMKNYLEYFIQTDEIIVRPSVGQGNYADVPWICLLSKNAKISPSPQKGLYIVLLFTKEGDAFYLTLSQGITNFREMKLSGKERDKIIKNTVLYFQEEINPDLINKYGFTKNLMNLGDKISILAKGYIKTTILSKRYEVDNFDVEDFKASLMALLFEYEEIIMHIGNKTYDDVISLINPMENIEPLDEAIEVITKTLDKNYVEYRDVPKTPIRVNRGELKSRKYNRITQQKIYSKIDYLDKAKEQQQTGLRGEQIALEIERKRLLDLNLDPNEHIKWCSAESDSYGYDFETVDYKNDELVKIYVEVKSTKDIKDTSFFVSKNEVNVSKEKQEQYRIFRIFDITSIAPKYYIADGELEDNFYLDPVTFSATYKYDVIAN
ncbi:MAG: DUF3578 domain-containing protein [Acholeplasmataceae bacterium]|jgi:hypothetical protein|nr:DUF3578 domain-containing protein [Acholeplasmataceae bacterium]